MLTHLLHAATGDLSTPSYTGFQCPTEACHTGPTHMSAWAGNHPLQTFSLQQKGETFITDPTQAIPAYLPLIKVNTFKYFTITNLICCIPIIHILSTQNGSQIVVC